MIWLRLALAACCAALVSDGVVAAEKGEPASWAADVTMSGGFTKSVSVVNQRGGKVRVDFGKALDPNNTRNISESERIVLSRNDDGALLLQLGRGCQAALFPTASRSNDRSTAGHQAYEVNFAAVGSPALCAAERNRQALKVTAFLKEVPQGWSLVLRKEWNGEGRTAGTGTLSGTGNLRPVDEVAQASSTRFNATQDRGAPSSRPNFMSQLERNNRRPPRDNTRLPRPVAKPYTPPPVDPNVIAGLDDLIAWLDKGCADPKAFHAELRARVAPNPNPNALAALMATSLMSTDKEHALIGLALLDEGNICEMRKKAEQCRDLGGPDNHAKRCDCAVTGMHEPKTGQYASLVVSNRHISSVSCPAARDAATDPLKRARYIVQDNYANGTNDEAEFERRISSAERLGYKYANARRATRLAHHIEGRMTSWPPLSWAEADVLRARAYAYAEKAKKNSPGAAVATAIHLDLMLRAATQSRATTSFLQKLFAPPTSAERMDAATKGALDQEALMRFEREQRQYSNSN